MTNHLHIVTLLSFPNSVAIFDYHCIASILLPIENPLKNDPSLYEMNEAFSVLALGAPPVSGSVEEDDEYDAEARAKRAGRREAAANAATASGETSSTKYGAIQKQHSTSSRSGR